MGAQLTFKSVRDEFNRERDGSAAGNGLGIQTDLRSAVKKKEEGGDSPDMGKEKERKGRREWRSEGR